MEKKIPLFLLLSLPAVLIWVVLFPQSGTRELFMQTEWRTDSNALLMMPTERDADTAVLESVFVPGGIQMISPDGRSGHFISGDVVAVLPGYRVVQEADTFVLVYSNDTRVELGKASVVVAREHLCALVSPDSHTVNIYMVDEGRFMRYETSSGISALDVMNDTSLILGTLDGRVICLDSNGRMFQEFSPPGSNMPCIYGVSWLQGDRELLVLSGLYPQRLHYYDLGAADGKFVPLASVEMPFAVRSRSLMMPVFDDRLVLFDLGNLVVLYESSQRLFHAIKQAGNLINAFMLKGTDILALGANEGTQYRISLIKPDGRTIATIERPGALDDFAVTRDTGMLVATSDGIARMRWSFR